MSATPPLGPPSAQPHQVLVVEDEQIVVLELHNRLTALGYRVTAAASGEQALRSIEQDRPDLVLMDIVLAGDMTGIQAAKLIGERFGLPVVYLSAYSDPATLEEIKQTEEHGFVKKPFQPQELHAVLQLALARHVKGQHRRAAERREYEEICQQSKEELEQFTYAASHDLQEPLRTASTFMDLLARRANPKLNEEERELLNQARAGLSRMNRLLHDLVAYARADHLLQTGPVPNIPAASALAGALENLHAAIAESDAHIVQNALPTVRADTSQLLQVFQNLISNAIKYRHSDRTLQIHINAERRGDEVVFCVRDNGIGFDPEYAEHIFAPLKRLHSESAYSGSGMGLAICRKIIEAHGGKIWAEATPEGGAAFSFSLPDKR